jgi:hypothetical protein
LYTRPAITYGSKVKEKKSALYEMLYEGFKNSTHYIKSDKMYYAYSRAIDYVVELIEQHDLAVDEIANAYEEEFPHIESSLIEYMEQVNEAIEDAKQANVKLDPTNWIPVSQPKQLDMFTTPSPATCAHKDTMFDTGMEQTYCLECFTYIDEKDAYYTNNFSQGRGYY